MDDTGHGKRADAVNGHGAAVSDFAPAFVSVLTWGIAPILIMRVGKAGFDSYTQTVYRYGTAAIVFLLISGASDPGGLTAALRAWRRTGPMALAVGTFQLTWVKGIYYTTPTVAVFAEHSSIVFSLVGSVFFFADERSVVLSRKFLLGAIVVAAGAMGVVLGGEARIEGGPVAEGGVARGGVYLLVAAVAWAAFSLMIKRFVAARPSPRAQGGPGNARGPEADDARLRPIPAFAVTIAEASLLVLAVTAIFRDAHDLGHIANVSARTTLELLVSGAVCVGIGQALYFVSISRIGVAASQTVILATPFLTGLFSFVLLGERMNAFQWSCGTVLMAAVAYLVNAGAAARQPKAQKKEAPSGGRQRG